MGGGGGGGRFFHHKHSQDLDIAGVRQDAFVAFVVRLKTFASDLESGLQAKSFLAQSWVAERAQRRFSSWSLRFINMATSRNSCRDPEETAPTHRRPRHGSIVHTCSNLVKVLRAFPVYQVEPRQLAAFYRHDDGNLMYRISLHDKSRHLALFPVPCELTGQVPNHFITHSSEATACSMRALCNMPWSL